jgi:DNA-binding MarR family transcriptional regulator
VDGGQPTGEYDSEQLLELCQQVMRSLKELRWRELLPLRLTMPQLKVLHVLSRRGKVSAGELADILAVSAPTVTDLVERMAAMGLVRKERGRTDRRVVYVCMTPAGEETLRQVRQEHWSVVRELLAEMTGEDRAALGRSLEALREAVVRYARRREEGSTTRIPRGGKEAGREDDS